MSVLFILVPVAIGLAAIGVSGFLWAVRTGQFEDVQTPAFRLLFEDEDLISPNSKTQDGPSASS
jgi:cbb3-type cytochrome oxidase maturation protein